MQTIEGELLELVTALTEKVVYKEIEGRETIRNVVQRTLQLVSDERKIVVHLHPEDLELLAEDTLNEKRGLTLMADKEIERGGCFVEAGKKVVDARLKTRLAEMVEALYGAR